MYRCNLYHSVKGPDDPAPDNNPSWESVGPKHLVGSVSCGHRKVSYLPSRRHGIIAVVWMGIRTEATDSQQTPGGFEDRSPKGIEVPLATVLKA